LWEAKRSRLAKRRTSPVSSLAVAATTGPGSEDLRDGGRGCGHRSGDPFLGVADLLVDAAEIVDER
jgi:hypothetical protein